MANTQDLTGKTYRAGIIGLTGIGQSPPRYDLWATRHPQPHSHASAHAAHPRVEVVAVCELVPELLTRYEENWGRGGPIQRLSRHAGAGESRSVERGHL